MSETDDLYPTLMTEKVWLPSVHSSTIKALNPSESTSTLSYTWANGNMLFKVLATVALGL